MIMPLYSIYQYAPDIFENFNVPASIDKETCVDNIVFECGTFGVAYQDPDFLKTAIAAWSKTRVDAWGRISDGLSAEYNPIENYDRTEESTDTGNVNGTANSENFNTSFESGEYQATQKNDTGSNTQSTVERKSRVHGNIGVTTNQQMLTQEMDMRKTDIYSIICNEFKRKFCICVYY